MNDIEILERYINGKDTMKESLVKAIENLLKERQADKDRIKELEDVIGLTGKKSRKKKNGTMRYKKTNKLNKYGVNGVCQDMRALKRTGEIKYRAYITLFGKQYTLGTHSTLEGAIKARKDGEKMIENILKNKFDKTGEKQ